MSMSGGMIMATWRQRFEEISAENGRQTGLWLAGNRNNDQLRAAAEAITEFTRQYQAAGEPERDTEMLPT